MGCSMHWDYYFRSHSWSSFPFKSEQGPAQVYPGTAWKQIVAPDCSPQLTKPQRVRWERKEDHEIRNQKQLAPPPSWFHHLSIGFWLFLWPPSEASSVLIFIHFNILEIYTEPFSGEPSSKWFNFFLPLKVLSPTPTF